VTVVRSVYRCLAVLALFFTSVHQHGVHVLYLQFISFIDKCCCCCW